MNYSILLNLHVTADIVWVVSMLWISASIAASSGYEKSTNAAGFNRLKRVNRLITTPSMVLAWILGLTLAIEGAWFGSNWLSAKLIFVLILSAVHGVQTKTLRKLLMSPGTRISLVVRLSPVIVVLCGLLIVWLALTKPL